jgi:hypothetical protein
MAATWICSKCGKPLIDGNGMIDVINANPDLGTVGTYPQRAAAPEEPVEHDESGAVDLASLQTRILEGMRRPNNVDFVVLHADCREGETFGYQIAPSQAQTLDAWVGWALHLCEKTWFGKDELERMLRFWYRGRGKEPPR